ncbi:MAG TPA: hypothetical protein VGW38_06325 [Chloroflexota bacterium]|nr:hypothetical protein [Chloroflexota bacterium]
MTPHDIAEFINTIGLPLAALLFVTAAFLTRKVVTREELAALQSRCDHLEAELQATREDLPQQRAPRLGDGAGHQQSGALKRLASLYLPVRGDAGLANQQRQEARGLVDMMLVAVRFRMQCMGRRLLYRTEVGHALSCRA